jgi:membrane protease YdiL (CAAX protease family)
MTDSPQPATTNASSMPPASSASIGARRPDPGTPRLARLASLAALVLLAVVVYLQQANPRAAQSQPAPNAPPTPAPVATIDPPESDQFLIFCKVVVKLAPVMNDPASKTKLDAQVRGIAREPIDKLRLTPVLAMIDSPKAALDLLSEVEKSLPADSPLLEDLRTLRARFERPDEPLTSDDARRLKEHHGYFGELADVLDKPDTDPARAAFTQGGPLLVVYLVAVAGLVGSAILAGFGTLITLVVMGFNGSLRWRHRPPAPGGSLGIEIVAVFIASFIALKLLITSVAHFAGQGPATWTALLAQWLLLGVALYPLLRGYDWAHARHALGLHAGQGFFREVGCGLVGYLACLPLYLAGVLCTLVVMIIQGVISRAAGGAPPEPPKNPMIEYFTAGPGPTLLLIGLLATVWAPLCEELVFRGALFRQLSARLPVVLAALFSATAFALMHAYGLALMFPLIGLGFGFALIRHWRGSLIASMTAHALHNASVLLIVLTLVRMLGL